MDNTLTIWTEQRAHIKIEDDNDTYTAKGILTPEYFQLSLKSITSDSNQEITEAIILRIQDLIMNNNKENSFQIKIEP